MIVTTPVIDVEVAKPFPIQTIIYAHELDENNHVNLKFYENGTEIPLTEVTIKMNVASESGVYIAEGATVNIATGGAYAWFPVSVQSGYTFLPGRNKVEFEFTVRNSEKHYTICPIIVECTPSVLDGTDITESSIGNLADFAREIVEARGDYDSLDARLTADEGEVGTLNAMLEARLEGTL